MSAPAGAPAATARAAEASPLLVRAAPAIFLLLWSVGFPVGKIGVSYTGPMTFLALRYSLVLLILVPALLLMRPPLPRTAAAWGHLMVVGILIQGLYFALDYVALASNVSAGAVALISSLQPILVALLARGWQASGYRGGVGLVSASV